MDEEKQQIKAQIRAERELREKKKQGKYRLKMVWEKKKSST